ncbi:hypothetical protein RvY_04540-1 [Ramazzottius varieornatus]|uniref:BLOC-1-related complex subunit 7 n=1 Tax=Ramazzottius varieornatus TaxID=947166 RepID=A0A1D1UXP3_RAMVA|nr:hypothetical protein RvY_04540-1 [Ramazzottius varieornatus]
MTEESIEKTAQRVQSSLRDLGIIARELLKGSRSEEVLSTAARSMVQHEGYIDNCSLNIARLEILSQQIALHEECMEQSLSNVEDLQWKLNSLTNRTKKLSADSSPHPPALDPAEGQYHFETLHGLSTSDAE